MELVSMEPPVRRILQSKPRTRRIKFDLFNDLPENVGSRFDDNYKNIFFKESDSDLILDVVDNYLSESSEPEENVVYDLHMVGIMPTEVGSRISADMRLWDNVKSLSYAAPRKSESLIFDTENV